MRDLTRHRRAVAVSSPLRRGRGHALAGALLAIAVSAAACGPAPSLLPSASSAAATAAATTLVPTDTRSPTGTPGQTGRAELPLQVSTLSLHLPVAVSRAVAFPDGESLLVAGGLTPSGTSATVVRIDLSAGQVTTDGRLASAVHDAGGALLAGTPMVFGGGNVVPEATVQRFRAGQGAVVGQLPRARADLVAVAIGAATLVVGGGTPARLDRAVLSTTDGSHFETVATLMVGARYAAAAAVGGMIIAAGGTDGAHDLADIQLVDPATGSVRMLGRLPHGLSHAMAIVIAGRILIAGGRSGGVAQDAIWEVDPVSGAVSLAGRLPQAVSDAAVVTVGDVGYLIGGERSAIVTSIVSISFG